MTGLKSNGIKSKRKRKDLTKYIKMSCCKHTQIHAHTHMYKSQTTDWGNIYSKYTNLNLKASVTERVYPKEKQKKIPQRKMDEGHERTIHARKIYKQLKSDLNIQTH